MKNDHIRKYEALVSRKDHERRNGHKSFILWFTGLSGAGKSTLAHAVELRFHQLNCATYVLDGDNVRHGLCSDLNFSQQDREENIRRVGEAAKLFIEAGVIAITAFISPFRADRNRVRALVEPCDFIEVYCNCSLEACELRDIKGLYAKARKGIISDFTGISSPYESPDTPELSIDTEKLSLTECVEEIMTYLKVNNLVETVC